MELADDSELARLVRGKKEVLVQLRRLGVRRMDHLGCLSERQIRSLGLADLVVQRRLITAAQTLAQHVVAQPPPTTLAELVAHDVRVLNKLNRAGVVHLDDLRELVVDDVVQLDLDAVMTRLCLQFLGLELNTAGGAEPPTVVPPNSPAPSSHAAATTTTPTASTGPTQWRRRTGAGTMPAHLRRTSKDSADSSVSSVTKRALSPSQR